jgi:peptidoglycan/xylan/chitin deacetylase (PgdA/CDA1 family)
MKREAPSLPILMYHGIRRSYCDELPPGWSRKHAIDAAAFTQQLDLIGARGSRSLKLSDLDLPGLPERSLLITFDDGHLSDYQIAAPELQGRGLSAAFFITWSYLGRPGYLSRGQVRELRAQSFEIGAHGLSHKRLTQMGPAELWREALDSKRRLEDLIGESIANFAIPSGSYNDLVLQTLWAAGYRRIMTSDFGLANPAHSVMHRMGVTAEVSAREFRTFLTASPAAAARRRLVMGMTRRLREAIGRVRMAPAALAGPPARRRDAIEQPKSGPIKPA